MAVSSANVRVTGDGGSDPGFVVNTTIQLFEDSPDYDRVYCVIDRDEHATFSEWSDRHRMLSSKASAEPCRWRTSRTQYLKAIMDCLSPTSPVERVVFMKAAQLGATEMRSSRGKAMSPEHSLHADSRVNCALYPKFRPSTSIKNVALAYNKENALNAICPYFTMFPLEYPNRVLKKHLKEEAIVLDPFCGRGTTLFSARRFGLSAWGIDSSPVAVAIAKAKLASCNLEEPLKLAAKLIADTDPVDVPDTLFFHSAYHRSTLRDICALREGLLGVKHETDASSILRAAALGCLHGPLPKHVENAGYFSNQMPRTYASKPDYAVRFWKERNLKAQKINVLRVLRRKIERLAGLDQASPCSVSHVLQGDAQSEELFLSISTAPSIVITSPPYYGMRTYVQDQWLRNWFLGGTEYINYSAGPQLDHGGQQVFVASLGKVWKNIANRAELSDSLHMYVRFGIIPSALVDAKKIFRASLEESGADWRLVSTRSAKSADVGKRQADQMKVESSAAVEFDFHVERI